MVLQRPGSQPELRHSGERAIFQRLPERWKAADNAEEHHDNRTAVQIHRTAQTGEPAQPVCGSAPHLWCRGSLVDICARPAPSGPGSRPDTENRGRVRAAQQHICPLIGNLYRANVGIACHIGNSLRNHTLHSMPFRPNTATIHPAMPRSRLLNSSTLLRLIRAQRINLTWSGRTVSGLYVPTGGETIATTVHTGSVSMEPSGLFRHYFYILSSLLYTEAPGLTSGHLVFCVALW